MVFFFILYVNNRYLNNLIYIDYLYNECLFLVWYGILKGGMVGVVVCG